MKASAFLVLLVPALAFADARKPPMYPKATPYAEVGGVSNDDKLVSEEVWTSKDSVAKVRAWFVPGHLKGFELVAGADGSQAKPFHIRDKAAHLEYVITVEKRDLTEIDIATRKE